MTYTTATDFRRLVGPLPSVAGSAFHVVDCDAPNVVGRPHINDGVGELGAEVSTGGGSNLWKRCGEAQTARSSRSISR